MTSLSVRKTLLRITGAGAGAAGILLLVAGCSGSSTHTNHSDNVSGHTTPHMVDYRVDGHGTADITWSGASGGTATHVTLPWHKTGQRNDGTHGATLTVVLGPTGGKATCSITVDGRRVGSSLARGSYGRAACTTQATTAAGSSAASDA